MTAPRSPSRPPAPPIETARALDAGFDYHLVKPADLDTLGDLVARLGGATQPGGPETHH